MRISPFRNWPEIESSGKSSLNYVFSTKRLMTWMISSFMCIHVIVRNSKIYFSINFGRYHTENNFISLKTTLGYHDKGHNSVSFSLTCDYTVTKYRAAGDTRA